jgi:fibronectin type 3 domain-containing protein
MKNIFNILIISFLVNSIFAQNEKGVVPSRVVAGPDGNHIFLYDKSNIVKNPYANTPIYNVSRAANGSNSFIKIGILQKPKTIQELSPRVSAETLDILRSLSKAKNDTELLDYLSKGTQKDFGLAALDLEFLQAIGLLYIDKDAKGNKNFTYKIEPSSGNRIGAIAFDEAVFDPLAGAIRAKIPVFKSSFIFATDSICRVRWSAAGAQNTNQIYFGEIFRQKALKGDFEQVTNRIMALFNNKADSLHYFYQDQTEPGNVYRYFVKVTDFVGNELARTDTATLISVDFNKIPIIKNVVVKDTLDGLKVSWSKLPNYPYYTGIQISRSRDVRERFIVIDTLSANASQYIDQRMLPNVTYYYQIRPLLFAVNNWGLMPSTPGNHFFQNNNRAPMPAHGLVAKNEGQGIRLSWKPTATVDVFAYYVMRSTSEKMKFEVVSPALKDTTYLDTTATLNGRSQYLYAVKIVNFNSKESTLSEQVSIRPLKYEYLHAPTGINGFVETGRVNLSWEDAKKYEPSVIGYLLYKRLATGKEITEPDKSAFLTFEKNGFQLAFPQVLSTTVFVDDNVDRGQTYEYAVAAVDAFQLQSPLSPTVKLAVEKPQLFPPTQVYVRNTSKGVEVAWPSSNIANLLGYNVYRKALGENSLQKITTTKATDLAFIDTTAKPKTQYLYLISFQTRDGESPKSIEKGVMRN